MSKKVRLRTECNFLKCDLGCVLVSVFVCAQLRLWNKQGDVCISRKKKKKKKIVGNFLSAVRYKTRILQMLIIVCVMYDKLMPRDTKLKTESGKRAFPEFL